MTSGLSDFFQLRTIRLFLTEIGNYNLQKIFLKTLLQTDKVSTFYYIID